MREQVLDYRCIVPSCSSVNGQSKKSDVNVFPLPKDPMLRCKWLGMIPGVKKRLTSTSGVCSLHFYVKDFFSTEKDELKVDSVPHLEAEKLNDQDQNDVKLKDLSDLADQLETHPEVLPSHIQHLTSQSQYTFYKIHFNPKKPPIVEFSLIIYSDLSFDVFHKLSSKKKFKFKTLQNRHTFRSIEEIRDVLEELDSSPHHQESSSTMLQSKKNQQLIEDALMSLSDLTQDGHPEGNKLEFIMEQIRLLEPSNQKQRTFSKKTLSAFKTLIQRLPHSLYKVLSHYLTFPELNELNDETVKEIKSIFQSLVDNAEFRTSEEFKDVLAGRIMEKGSPIADMVGKTLNKLWNGNTDEYSTDISLTVFLLLNEIFSLYSGANIQDESFSKNETLPGEIVIKEEFMEDHDTSSIRGDDDLEEIEEDQQVIEHGEVDDTEEQDDDDDDDDFFGESRGPAVKSTYSCCFCTMKLQSLNEFLRHCSDMHAGVDVVLKITPGPVLTIKSSLKEFTCADCKKDFTSLANVNNHIDEHVNIVRRSTRSGKKKILLQTCSICQVECLDKARLKEHYSTAHPTYSIFECKRCSQLFHKCSEYLKHKLYFHKKRPVNPDKLYDCELCDNKFRFRHHLDKHYASDHHQKKYTCDLCGRLFDTQRYLTKHKARVHPNSFDYICELCGKKFAINEYLNSHKKICKFRRSNTSTEGKKFQCDKCFRYFSSEVYLANHKAVIHEKTKAYVCSVCDKHLVSLVNLRLHMATHDENRPKFNCQRCGKEYLNKTTLQFHILTTHEKKKSDKSFKCNYCDWSFWEKKNLKNHIKLVHDKIYEHKCDICGRAFGCRRHLLRHKTTIHDKFREFKCHLCSVEYFQRPSLKNHLKKVHNVTDYMPPKVVKE